MRILLGSVLLLGAIITSSLAAQTAQTVPSKAHRHFDVAFTFNASHSNAAAGNGLWMQGGSAQVHIPLWRGFGAVADIVGLHTGNINSTGLGLDMVTAAFGPRYTWSPPHGRVSFFGQGLAGEAFGFHGIFPGVHETHSSASSLAVQVGGGMDFTLSRRIAVRAFEGRGCAPSCQTRRQMCKIISGSARASSSNSDYMRPASYPGHIGTSE